MSLHVAIARKAAREIEEQYNWLAKRSEAAANRWRTSLLQAIDTLADHPERCPRRQKLNGMRGCANCSTANAGVSIASFSRFAARP